MFAVRARRALGSLSAVHRSLSGRPLHAAPSPARGFSRSSSLPPVPSSQLHSRTCRSSTASLLAQGSCSRNLEDGGPDAIPFHGRDYNHWLITVDFPEDPKPTPEEMVRTYEEICAKGLNISVEEAKKRLYACSTTTYQGFQAVMTEAESEQFRGIPGVDHVLPDSYRDPQNKDYGGDIKYENGVITHRPPIQNRLPRLRGSVISGCFGPARCSVQWPKEYHRSNCNDWLIMVRFPRDPKPTPKEMVRTFEEICAKGLNISVEEAKKRIYACSTSGYHGFQAVMTEAESEQFRGIPGVVYILPDLYKDRRNKEYGGDIRYEDGVITLFTNEKKDGVITDWPPSMSMSRRKRVFLPPWVRVPRRGDGRFPMPMNNVGPGGQASQS